MAVLKSSPNISTRSVGNVVKPHTYENEVADKHNFTKEVLQQEEARDDTQAQNGAAMKDCARDDILGKPLHYWRFDDVAAHDTSLGGLDEAEADIEIEDGKEANETETVGSDKPQSVQPSQGECLEELYLSEADVEIKYEKEVGYYLLDNLGLGLLGLVPAKETNETEENARSAHSQNQIASKNEAKKAAKEEAKKAAAARKQEQIDAFQAKKAAREEAKKAEAAARKQEKIDVVKAKKAAKDEAKKVVAAARKQEQNDAVQVTKAAKEEAKKAAAACKQLKIVALQAKKAPKQDPTDIPPMIIAVTQEEIQDTHSPNDTTSGSTSPHVKEDEILSVAMDLLFGKGKFEYDEITAYSMGNRRQMSFFRGVTNDVSRILNGSSSESSADTDIPLC